jgi:hypothetical protein
LTARLAKTKTGLDPRELKEGDQAMRDQLVERVKSVLRPMVRHRTLIERAKFIGTPILDPQSGNDRIAELLVEGKPRALGKMGASELGGLRRFEGGKDPTGICRSWGSHRGRLNLNAGVYPEDDAALSRFCQSYSRTLGELDLLAVWFHRGERQLVTNFAAQATLVSLTALEPFYHQRPWSQHLSGKRVLVVSPFSETIKSQYVRREQVWRSRPEVLPTFELDTLRCPLSAMLVKPAFPDWFTALEAMQQEMSRRSFDVLLVGAGAWSLALAAYAKREGKWAIHLGGPLQLLFGIRGGRWDNHPFLQTVYNEAWVRPSPADRPETFTKIENGCYW